MSDIPKLKFDSMGLIPAIVREHYSGEVLMLAYMNEESFNLSISVGYTCFYSRSRSSLWRKGETSGNRQEIVRILCDCDADTLLVDVIQTGVACHTGAFSCFNSELYCTKSDGVFSTTDLHKLLQNRKLNPVEGSYTTYLFEKGVDKILKKIGEEMTEVVIAAKDNNRAETIYELADLYYHSAVLMAEMGITPAEITIELARRHGKKEQS